METLTWQSSFDTGIEEIDNQHRDLLDYLNQLSAALSESNQQRYAHVIAGLFDYTLSHFAFEEALMEEAGYTYLGPHQNVHKMLLKRVGEFESRLKGGEDVGDELYGFLRRWLLNHIQRDDKAYAAPVKKYLGEKMKAAASDNIESSGKGWLGRMVSRFFK